MRLRRHRLVNSVLHLIRSAGRTLSLAQEIVMNSRCLIIAAALAGAAALAIVAAPVTVQAQTMKECAAEWDKMKAANQTGGIKYRDFTKQCMSGGAPAATAPAPAAPAPAAGAATPSA